MRKFSFVLFLCSALALLTPQFAQAQCQGIPNPGGVRPIAGSHEEVAVSSTAVGLTIPSAPPIVVRFAIVTVKGESVVTADDGTTPTASTGHLWQAGERFFVCQPSLATFLAIRASGDASLAVSYYGN